MRLKLEISRIWSKNSTQPIQSTRKIYLYASLAMDSCVFYFFIRPASYQIELFDTRNWHVPYGLLPVNIYRVKYKKIIGRNYISKLTFRYYICCTAPILNVVNVCEAEMLKFIQFEILYIEHVYSFPAHGYIFNFNN